MRVSGKRTLTNGLRAAFEADLRYARRVTYEEWADRAVTRRPVVSAGQYGTNLNQLVFTVTDPDTWAEPWGGTYPLTDLGGVLFEYACTEGNYGMANILSGQRAVEREAAGQ